MWFKKEWHLVSFVLSTKLTHSEQIGSILSLSVWPPAPTSLFFDMNTFEFWHIPCRAYSSFFCPVSNCFQIFYIFAQTFKYFTLFCLFETFCCPLLAFFLKNHTHALTFYKRPCLTKFPFFWPWFSFFAGY